MSLGKTFWDLFVKRFIKENKPGESAHSRKRSLQLETLEERQMLSGISIISSPDIVEEGQSAIIRLQRDDTQGDLTTFFELDYRNSSCSYYQDWATQGKDFDWLPGTGGWSRQGHVTFRDGEAFAEILINAKADEFLESDEQISLKLITSSNFWGDRTGVSSNTTYTIDQDHSSTSLIIKDMTTPVTVWVNSVENGTEGGTNPVIQLERDNTEKELTVYYKLDDRNSGYYYYTNQNPVGWARNGTDFQWLPGTDQYTYNNIGKVTFAAGEKNAEITFHLIDDDWMEGTEQVGLTLQQQNGCYGSCCFSGISYYLDADRSSAIVSIFDDEPEVTVWIERTQDGSEGGSNGFFELKRDNVERALTVYYRLNDKNNGCSYCYYDELTGWATNGEDFEYLPGTSDYWSSYGYGTITFEIGNDTVQIPVVVKEDTKAEGTENLQITLTQRGPYDSNNNVRYNLDTTRSSATISIHDNEPPIMVWIAATHDSTEGGTHGYFQLERSNSAGRIQVFFQFDPNNFGTVAEGWAQGGTDFEWPNNWPCSVNSSTGFGYVYFEEGQTTVNIPIKWHDDNWIEGPEEVRISLLNSNGDGRGEVFQVDPGMASASLSIIDNEVPVTVRIEKIQDGAEGGDNGIFRIYRDVTGQSLTVWFELHELNSYYKPNTFGWGTNGRDFNWLPGTSYNNNRGSVTFGASDPYVDIYVRVIDDGRMEGPEKVVLTLSENEDGRTYFIDETQNTATLDIIDNEEIINVWIEEVQDGIEGTQDGFVRVRRDDATKEQKIWFEIDNNNRGYVNIQGWARNGVDFTLLPNTNTNSNKGYITFAAGIYVMDIPFAVIDDRWVEETEKIEIRLVQEHEYCYFCCGYNDEGVKYLLDPATSTATVLIHDNEVPVKVWIEDTGNGQEGSHDGYITIKRSHTEGELTVWFQLDPKNHSGCSYCSYSYEGWAVNGRDFEFLPGTSCHYSYGKGSVTFEDGQDTLTIPITVKDDIYIEGDEQIGFTLVQRNVNEPEYLFDEERISTTVIIHDNDESITVWVGEIRDAIEGTQEGYIRVYRDNAYRALEIMFELDGYNMSYSYYDRYYDEWAKNGVDMEFLPGTGVNVSRGKVTFEEGKYYVDIPIIAHADGLYEGTEKVKIRLVNENGTGCCYYSHGVSFFVDTTQNEATVNIIDSDEPVNVWIDETKDAVEGAEAGYIRIRRDNADREVIVYYDMDARNASGYGYEETGCCYYCYDCNYVETYTSGWAKNGYDFEVLLGSQPRSNRGEIKFEVGVYYIDIPIVAHDDGKVEGNETVSLSLVTPGKGPSGSIPYSVDQDRKMATVEIEDANLSSFVWIETEKNATEGGEIGYFVIRRDHKIGKLTVHYTFDKDASTATWSDDFYQLEGMTPGGARGTLVFEDGMDMIRVPVIAKRDNLVEGTETVVIKLLPGSANAGAEPLVSPYTVDENRDTATINIFDNNSTATVWIDSVGHGHEGGQDGYFRIHRDDATSSLRVSYRINNDSTATLGQDYDYLPGTNQDQTQYGFITFDVGVYFVDIPIRVIDDHEVEPTETVSITLIPGDETIGGLNAVYEIDQDRATATMSIYDNDTKPTVWFGEIHHGEEGGENGFVRVYRNITHSDLTVRYLFDSEGSSATMGLDFTTLPGMKDGSYSGIITFKAGEEYVDIPIQVLDDRLVEDTETVRLVLTTGLGNYEIGDEFEAIVNIYDNDTQTHVWLDDDTSVQHGEEGVRDGYVRVYRDRTDRPLTIYFEYDANSSSAVLGEDFQKFPGMPHGTNFGSVTFEIGKNYVDIPIVVIDDNKVEATETVLIRLHQGTEGDASSYILTGTKTTALVEIVDNDEAANVWIDSVQDAYEGDTGHVRIYRSNTSGSLRVGFQFDSDTATATFGDDFNFGGVYDPATGIGYVDFSDGQEYVDLAIHALHDLLLEHDETVPITLLDSTDGQYKLEGTTSAIMTIFDTGEEEPVPDAWRVGVFATDPFASENGPNTGEFTVVRSGHSNLNQPLTVRFRLSGSATLIDDYDFEGLNITLDEENGVWIGSFTFQPGKPDHVFKIVPKADALEEGTELVVFTLLPSLETDTEGNPLYAVETASTATVSIEDSVKVVDPIVDPATRTNWDVNVTATDRFASEDGTNPGEFTFVRSGMSDLSQALTVWFRITGSATPDSDYVTNLSLQPDGDSWIGSITIAAGATHYALSLVPKTDDYVEGDETVILTLLATTETNESGEPLYLVGSKNTDTVIIRDATQVLDPLTEPPARETWDVSVIATDAYASENRENPGEFTIKRSGLTDLSQPLTVWFEITGTATHAADYQGLDVTVDPQTGKLVGCVTFQANQKYVVIKIQPIIDTEVEGNETVVLTLLPTPDITENGNPTYTAKTGEGEALVTIEDQTVVPAETPWVSGDPEILEGRWYELDLHDNETGVIRWEINWGDGSPTETYGPDDLRVRHFYDDGDEHYTISITAVKEGTGSVEPVGGWQGLSHGYWKNHAKDWVFYKTTDNYEAVFGVSNSQKPGSLMQAVKTGGGGIKALWRESVAALNNATHPNVLYKFSVDEIIAMVQTAYATGRYEYYKDILETENTRHNCDIKKPYGGASGEYTGGEERIELEKELFVKNVAPDLTITGESKVQAGEPYVLHMDSFDPGDDTITQWIIYWGDGNSTVVSNGEREITHHYQKDGIYTIRAQAVDEDGTWNSNELDVFVYTPQTGLVKGTPWISGDPEILEGRQYTLDLHANEADIVQWEIHWGAGQGETKIFDGNTTQVFHDYLDGDENMVITVTAVKNNNGTMERITMEHALKVINVPPTLVISGASKIEKDSEYLLNLSSFDPGQDTITHWLIQFGEGTDPVWVTGDPDSVTHTFTETGWYTISAKAVDEDGTWTANTIDVFVYVPETGLTKGTPYVSGDPEILEGRTYTLYLHANEANIVGWEITWQDGVTKPYAGTDLYATHFYADGDEEFQIRIVAIKSVDGIEERVELTHDLKVVNVPPTLVISGNTSVPPKTDYVLHLSSADPGDDTITQWIIDWGDGVINYVDGNPSHYTHPYKESGIYTITAKAVDEDGTWEANTLTVYVKDGVIVDLWKPLDEETHFVAEARLNVEVTAENQALVLSIRNLRFDGSSSGKINDAFEIALVDANGTPLVATIRTTRDGFLNITEGVGAALASGVIYDAAAGKIILDLSKLAVGTKGELVLRLVNNDDDTGTGLEYYPVLSYIDSPFGTYDVTTPQENPGNRQKIDFAHIQDVTSLVSYEYGRTTFNDQRGILRAGLTLTNSSYQQLRGPILVAIKGISDPSVTVTGYDGMTPDGLYYFDVSHFAFSGQDYMFDPDEIIRGLDLQFLNPDHVQFDYEIVILAHINEAPTFVSTPKTEITAGNEYTYGSNATDPENDTLTYEKVFGPEGMIVDAKTGAITWKTTSGDVGIHDVMIRVYDTEKLYDEQRFQINVTDWINLPPYFTSTPVTESFVGTVYHYQATADDPDGDDLEFKFINAYVTGTGQSLSEFHATHQLTVSKDGMVTWNPPAELIGQTITVILEVTDPHGATALQEYLIAVHADPVNNPPVIITTPPTEYVLPKEGNPSLGTVTPGRIDLQLDEGQSRTETISVVLGDYVPMIDVFLLFDDTGSYSSYPPQLAQTLPVLIKTLMAQYPETDFGFGVGRFEDYGDAGPWDYADWRDQPFILDMPILPTDYENFDDYIKAALNAKHSGSGGDDPESLIEALYQIATGQGFPGFTPSIDYYSGETPLFGNIGGAGFRAGSIPIIIVSGDTGTVYQPDGASYIVGKNGEHIPIEQFLGASRGSTPNGQGATIQQTIDALNDIGAIVIGLTPYSSPTSAIRNLLEAISMATGSVNSSSETLQNGLPSDPIDPGDPLYYHFSGNAADMANQIASAVGACRKNLFFDVVLVSSDPRVTIHATPDQVNAVLSGEQVFFDVTFTGDGETYSFDLLLVRAGTESDLATATIIGSIPITIRPSYSYDCDAIDPDGDELLYSLLEGPEGATINPQTGQLNWNPTVPGEYKFTVHVTDGRGGEDTQSWTLTVKENDVDNTPPTLDAIDDMILIVGQDISMQLKGNDKDGDLLSYYIVNDETNGKRLPEGLTVNRYTGQLQWKPTLADLGTHEITVEVIDGHGGKATQKFTITVTQDNFYANNKPGIDSIAPVLGVVGKAYRYDVSGFDIDHDVLTYDLVNAPAGMAIDAETGTIIWTPKAGQVGEHEVTIRVSDGRGGFAYQQYRLSVVVEINVAPVIISEPSGPVVLDQEWKYQVVAVDQNGDKLTYAIDAASTSRGMTIDEKGLLKWTPTETGIYDVMILVDDGRGGQDVQAFSIEITSVAPPEITSTPTGPAFIDEEWTYPVETDQDPNTYTLTLDADSLARGMIIDENDVIRWTPKAVGEAQVKVTLTDQYGGKYVQTFTIHAQSHPVASYPPSIDSEPVGPVYVGEWWEYTVVVTDPENYAVTIYLVDEDGIPIETPDDGDLRWKDGVLQWKPEDTSAKKFIIRAENEHGAWSEQTFTITPIVRPAINEAPVITSVPLGPTMVGENYTYQVEAFDPDGDALTYTVDETSKLAGITINDNGMLRWSPTEAGPREITVIVTDSHGNARMQTFLLDVDPRPIVSQPPVILSKPTGPVYLGDEWFYTITAYDPEQDAFTLSLWDDDIQDWVAIDPLSRTITWTPDAVGEKSFTIRAEDAHGFWSEQSFVIKAVEAPADVEAPRIISVPTGPAFVDERYEYQVTAQVFDGSQPTFTVDQASADLGITINAQGKLSWIPGVVGTFTIVITVTDGNDKSTYQTFDLETVQRQIVTVPPTITSKPIGPAYRGEIWEYQLTATAADGGNVDFYHVVDGEEIPIENGKFKYTWNELGTQNLIVRAVDSRGASIDQHITIEVVEWVDETNAPPVIYSIPIEQVRLENAYQYKVKAFDPNNDSLSYSLINNPVGASISSDGVLTWNPSVLGNYEFTIRVSDTANNWVEQNFTVTVLPPVTINTPPQITSVPLTSAMKDREYQYQAIATDLDGDRIYWYLGDMDIPDEARGNLQINRDTGLLTWTPGVAGTFTFTIAAFDGNEYAEQVITLYVADNAPPIITAVPDPNLEYGQPYSGQVVAYDPNGDEITYRLENNPDPETLRIGADGTVTWESPILGRHNITVVVTDSKGAEVRRQFQLNVVDTSVPNEAPSLVGSMPGSVPVNVPFTYQLGATDPENDPVTFKLVDGPDGMTISSGGRIEWTPSEVGDVTFQVELFDGTNRVVYTCSFAAVAQRENSKPVFTSQSATSVTVNKQYVYKPTATDPDGDSVTITLVNGPSDLKMNAQGEIVWTPASTLAGQKISFTLRATDAYGASTDQVVELTVRSVVLAPNVDMTKALPTGYIGEKMGYQIIATDPQGEKLTYVLEGMIRYENYPNEPIAMPIGDAKVDANGYLSWTPTVEGIVGFRVRVVNESGFSTPVVVFPMMVINKVPTEPGTPTYNNPPSLTLPESSYIEAGKPYTHQIVATDPDVNDTLAYELTEGPIGMRIDRETGIITWSPGPGENMVGQVVKVSVSVSDGQLTSSGWYYLGITEANKLPKIKEIGAQTVTAGGQFRYYVSATDENKTDILTYSLDDGALALGLQINAQTGLISWNPGTERAGEVHLVKVYVTDGRGEPQSASFLLSVAEDKIAPTVNIVATPSKTAAGDQVTIYVSASDNIGVMSVTLKLLSKTIRGEEIPVNKTIALVNGKAVYTLDANEYGTLTFEAIAEDAKGNTGRATTTVQATNPADTEAPTVGISSHGPGSKIYGPVDIIGTVTDTDPDVSWTLKAISVDNGKEVLISEGNGNVEKGVLGRFDTTMLRNGTWWLVLEAVDVGGNTSVREFKVELEGDYKLGNFNMSFTDFDIMLSGLGITITRTYDTLNADVMGDFGYGWTLDIATTEISVVIGDGDNAQNGFSPYTGISDGTHITITLPDGTKEGFTFQAVGGGYGSSSPYAGMIPSQYYKPSWIPDPGTKSTLQADDTWLYPWGDGTYYQMDSWDLNQSDYSPANINGGFLTLTLRNGIDLMIDATNGKLHQAIDQSGNTLTFTANSISHSSGKGVQFERDYQGRITAITGPDGGKVTYEYDALGNLVATTDQSGATSIFTYLSGANDPEHYLDEVIDPLGRPVAKTEYDESGRVVKMTDADGKSIVYEWDVTGQIQKVTDQLGNTTTYYNDEHGNIVREISPEGMIKLRSFDSSGNILTVTLVVERDGLSDLHLTTEYTYDADGNRLTETDARGNVTKYIYNKYGQLLSISTNGVSNTTNYDSRTGLPTSSTDTNGNTVRFTFDNKGNLTNLTNASGVNLVVQEHNKYGEVTCAIADGRATYYEYDQNGNCISEWYTELGVTILTNTSFDANKRVTYRERIVDGNCVWKTSMEHDDLGRVIKKVDENELETTYKYDLRGNLTETRTQIKDSAGNIVTEIKRNVYDACSNLIYSNSFIEGTPSINIYGTHVKYDKDGRSIESNEYIGLVIEINVDGSSFVATYGNLLLSTNNTYNNAGWLVASTDSSGLKSEYTYDIYGSVTLVRQELPNGEWLHSERVYNTSGDLVYIAEFHKLNAPDIVGTYTEYDLQGRVVCTTKYKGSIVIIGVDGSSSVSLLGQEFSRQETIYDAKGRMTSKCDEFGNTISYAYDSFDRVIAITYPTGLRELTTYDNYGRVSEISVEGNGETRTTKYIYDAFGNCVECILPDGTKISSNYNDKGLKISETNQDNITRYFNYDDVGRLTKIVIPQALTDDIVYEYEYDALGNQTSITDPNGNTTMFSYDNNGNMLTRTLPDGATEQFSYDNLGRQIRHISFEGAVSTTVYDALGRVIAKRYYISEEACNNDDISEEWLYEYDNNTKSIAVSRSYVDEDKNDCTTTFINAQGLVESVNTEHGAIYYKYNSQGQITETTLDSGETICYSYDRFGRLSSVISDGVETTYMYDSFGNLNKEYDSNGKSTVYTYDIMNRITQIFSFYDDNSNGMYDSNDTRISNFSYTYNYLGQKSSAIETVWTDIDNDGEEDELNNAVSWNYDDLGRIVSEIFEHYAQDEDMISTWEYDLTGNRIKQTVNGEDTFYYYDANDRLLHEISGEKHVVYTYNATQQFSKEISINGILVSVTSYEYNNQGRMSNVTITTDSKVEKISYEYNSDGLRTGVYCETWTDNEPVVIEKSDYLYDSVNHTGYAQVIKKVETSNRKEYSKTTTYTIGLQRLHQKTTEGNSVEEYSYIYDGRGSTRVLVDATNTVVEFYSFDAYGNSIDFSPDNAKTEFLYNGEQFDSLIMQQYLRQRYYDPANGRFNRLDPFFGDSQSPQSFHKYLYAHGDPINLNDPTGLMAGANVGVAMSMGTMLAATFGTSLVLNTGVGIYNAMSGGTFSPDASLVGVCLTGNIPLADVILQGMGSFFFVIGSYGALSPIPEAIIVHGLQRLFNISGGISPFTGPGSPALSGQLNFTGGVELVTTATDLKQAYSVYGAIELATGNYWGVNFLAYTGMLWDLPLITDYKGPFVGFGANFSSKFFSGSVNYVQSLNENSRGRMTKGVTTGLGFGSGDIPFEFAGYVGYTLDPWITRNEGYDDLSYYLGGNFWPPFYAYLLVQKAYENSQQNG